jgi:tRNA threonylcarbamoyladenosine biosynthesis protein TsaB
LNTLVIDTSGDNQIVAVKTGDRAFYTNSEVDVSHSITLFETIDTALKSLDITLNELNLIGVGLGPGSFTGIRIAVTTARMFSQILNIPIVGLKTHEIYASCISQVNCGENILIAFDARKGRVYGALYRKETIGTITEIIPPGDYYIEFILDSADNKIKTTLVGDGCIKFYDKIISSLENTESLFSYQPFGSIICDIAEKEFLNNQANSTDYNLIIPFYARKSDAEVIKDASK